MKPKNKKRKALMIEASLPHKRIKQLQSYYLQGNKWRKVKFFDGGNVS